MIAVTKNAPAQANMFLVVDVESSMDEFLPLRHLGIALRQQSKDQKTQKQKERLDANNQVGKA
jgi:hypothetical protein